VRGEVHCELCVGEFHPGRHDVCVGEFHPGHRELCVGEFHPGRHELRTGEFRPSHGELGRQSERCARTGSAWAVVSCTWTSSTQSAASWAASAPPEMSAGGRGRAQDECGRPPPWPAATSCVGGACVVCGRAPLQYSDFFRNYGHEQIKERVIWAGIGPPTGASGRTDNLFQELLKSKSIGICSSAKS
jgi:hypothetical protein